MKKVSYEYGKFIKSNIYGVYDLIDGYTFPFYFLKFSEPKENYLKNNGAVHVMQSWEKGNEKIKTLHTGLIPLGNGYFFGNNLNNKNKLDFIVMGYLSKTKEIEFWLIKNHNPRQKKRFAEKFITNLKTSTLK